MEQYYEIDTFIDLKHNFTNERSIKRYYKYLKRLNTRCLYFQNDNNGNIYEFFTGRTLYKMDDKKVLFLDLESGLYLDKEPKEVSLEYVAKKIRNVYLEPVDRFFKSVDKLNNKEKKLLLKQKTMIK